jgi:hypothetical protein
MLVTMHFGDGSSKDIEVESDEYLIALEEAKEWVSDNAWFEVTNDSDEVVATTSL